MPDPNNQSTLQNPVGRFMVAVGNEHSEYAWVTPEEALKKVTEPGIRRDINAYSKHKQSIAQQVRE